MKVNFLDLKKNYLSIKSEIDKEISNVIETTSFVSGDTVKRFESSFSSYLNVKYCIGVGNGTDALEIALQSLGITEGDEVITQANTFVATVFAISTNKAIPVLVDCYPDTCMINIEQIESKITKKTKAIIPVHMYGACADMDKIILLAKKYNLFIIEDCAQAHGALYKNQRVGSFGDIGCFSFYPGKNLGAFGDGGALVTNNEQLYEKINLLHNLGSKTKYHHQIQGRNSRLDSIQAGVLIAKLSHLDDWNEKRRKIANHYTDKLKSLKHIDLLSVPEDCQPVYHLYVIRTTKRDELKKYLESHDIFTNIHYPIPIHKLEAYSQFNSQSYPISESLSATCLSLPMYPELTEEEVNFVITKIKQFYTLTV